MNTQRDEVTEDSLRSVVIDCAQLAANARAVSETLGAWAADVRADAYGHGAAEVARIALTNGAELVVVSDDRAAAELREAGIGADHIRVQAPASDPAPGLPIVCESLYGFESPLAPAMRVTGTVIGVKRVAAGEGVSYGYTYRTSRPTWLAMIALGYANGVDRAASNVGAVWLGGARRPIAGRVAMNVLMVDLGDDVVGVGNQAVLFGDPHDGEPAIWEWADAIGAPVTEVAAMVGAHMPRVHVSRVHGPGVDQ